MKNAFIKFIKQTTDLNETELLNIGLIADSILSEVDVEGMSEYEMPDVVYEHSEKLGFLDN